MTIKLLLEGVQLEKLHEIIRDAANFQRVEEAQPYTMIPLIKIIDCKTSDQERTQGRDYISKAIGLYEATIEVAEWIPGTRAKTKVPAMVLLNMLKAVEVFSFNKANLGYSDIFE